MLHATSLLRYSILPNNMYMLYGNMDLYTYIYYKCIKRALTILVASFRVHSVELSHIATSKPLLMRQSFK